MCLHCTISIDSIGELGGGGGGGGGGGSLQPPSAIFGQKISNIWAKPLDIRA